MSATLFVIGRVLLGGAFVFAGIRNTINFAYHVGFLTGRGLPLAKEGTMAALAFQIACGLLIVLNIWSAIAALGLVAFVVVATILYHNFWDHSGPERVQHVNATIGSVAMVGGLLMVAAAGL